MLPTRRTKKGLKLTINGREMRTSPDIDPSSFYTILNVHPGEKLGEAIQIDLDKGRRKEEGHVFEGVIYINDIPTRGQIIYVKGYHRNIIGWKQLHDLGLIPASEHRYVLDAPPVLLTGDESKIWTRQKYITRIHLIEDAKRILRSWERDGIIEKCESVCNAPIQLSRKPNKKVKIHFDYSRLNSCTEKVSHDKIDRPKAIENITAGNYYSVIKLYYGEWQIPLDTNTKYKTAFTFLGQQYAWNRLPGRFKNSSAILSKTLEKVLNQDVLPQNMRKRITYYIDTMLISADTETECRKFTNTLQQHLEDSGFILHGNQDQICKQKVVFLGREINPDSIRLGEDYLKKIRGFNPLKDESQLNNMLSCLNDAKQLTPGFSVLTQSVKKAFKENCMEEKKRALQALMNQVFKNRPAAFRLKDGEPCTVQIFSNNGAWMAEILNSAKKPYRSESGILGPTKKEKSLAVQELKAMIVVWGKHDKVLMDRAVEWEVESPDVARYKENPECLQMPKQTKKNLMFLLEPENTVTVVPAENRIPPVQWPVNLSSFYQHEL